MNDNDERLTRAIAAATNILRSAGVAAPENPAARLVRIVAIELGVLQPRAGGEKK